MYNQSWAKEDNNTEINQSINQSINLARMFESADSPMKSDFSPDACSRMREKKSFALFLPHEIYGVDAREERNYTAANQILQPHEIFGVDAREERNYTAANQILLPNEIFGVDAPMERENGQDNSEDSNGLQQRNTPVKNQLSDKSLSLKGKDHPSKSNQAIGTEKSIPVHESQSMGQKSAHDSSEESNKPPTKKWKLFCFCFRF
jgi:hypothetical protein